MLVYLCAMPEEIGSTLKNIKNISQKKFGDLHIFQGNGYILMLL